MISTSNTRENQQQFDKFPLVSVIIPAYNAEAFIGETIESVLAQTYRNFEVVVIDDGSQDRTGEIVQKFSERDSRIRLIQQPNAGVVSSRNRAIELAEGELIAPLDSDDIWMPENLEKQVHYMMKSDSSVGVVYAWSFDIDEQSNPTGEFHAFTIEGNVYGTLLCRFFLGNASSSLIRKTCLEKVGLYRTQKDLPQGCEDWELYLRLAECYQFKAVPQFLIAYRKHLNSMTNNTEVMAKFLSSIWEQTLEKYPNIPKAIYRISHSNFFLYLSAQSDILGQSQSSLLWLYRSLKVGRVFSLMRPVFYVILVKQILRKFGLSSYGKNQKNNLNSSKKNQNNANSIHQAHKKILPNEQHFSVRTKTLLGNLLYGFVSASFGNPEAWKKEA